MILDLSVKNCYIFKDLVTISLNADMREKRLVSNVHSENNFNVLKVLSIYGQNNSGKTCIIKCIKLIKNIILNDDIDFLEIMQIKNKYCDDALSEIGITFLHEGIKYKYELKFDIENYKITYFYEKISQIKKDRYNNVKKEEIFLLRDTIKEKYESKNKEIDEILPYFSKKSISIHLLDSEDFKEYNKIKHILTSFANNIEIIDMNYISPNKTIDILKNKKNEDIINKINDLVKNSDIYLENLKYIDEDTIKKEDDVLSLDELSNKLGKDLKFLSFYKGFWQYSLLFDSVGTQKIIALSSYIVESLKNGKILVIDELDSSLHFKLVKSIVALFNNVLNDSAQLIFTTHDINLMDCKNMFRKEQIWFVHKDETGVYLYSLADFTAKDGVRADDNILKKYLEGTFGALPEPDLIDNLIDIKNLQMEG